MQSKNLYLLMLQSSQEVLKKSIFAIQIEIKFSLFYCDQPLFVTENDPHKLLKLACIADILNFPDYTLGIMEHLTLSHGADPRYNLANTIFDRLSQFSDLVEQGLENLPVIQSIQDYIRF
ncbi:hypothetical protein [Synechocystis sp. LKSZ1]|uniref:hypothetical protein n=1 Tax=Synechocystis sp. LKSZ1 TaxID=3144951 RepID=UPI00336C0CD7